MQGKAKILDIWGGLRYVLKMLFRRVTWEGFSTSKLKACFVFSILLVVHPIAYVRNMYCAPTVGQVLCQVQEGFGNNGELYKKEWDVASSQRSLESGVDGGRKPTKEGDERVVKRQGSWMWPSLADSLKFHIGTPVWYEPI